MSGESIRVFGLDPSLSSTGVACVQFDTHDDAPVPAIWADRVSVSSRGCQRIDEIVRQTAVLLSSSRLDEPGASNGFSLIVIEGPIYRTPKYDGPAGKREPSLRGYHERAGLWWALVCRLRRMGVPFAVCPPSNLKKWATNNGNASKDKVLARIASEFPAAVVQSNDEADALVCALMGAHRLYGDDFPFAVNQQYRRAALTGVEWPIEPDSLGFAGPFAALAFGADAKSRYPAIAAAVLPADPLAGRLEDLGEQILKGRP